MPGPERVHWTVRDAYYCPTHGRTHGRELATGETVKNWNLEDGEDAKGGRERQEKKWGTESSSHGEGRVRKVWRGVEWTGGRDRR